MDKCVFGGAVTLHEAVMGGLISCYSNNIAQGYHSKLNEWVWASWLISKIILFKYTSAFLPLPSASGRGCEKGFLGSLLRWVDLSELWEKAWKAAGLRRSLFIYWSLLPVSHVRATFTHCTDFLYSSASSHLFCNASCRPRLCLRVPDDWAPAAASLRLWHRALRGAHRGTRALCTHAHKWEDMHGEKQCFYIIFIYFFYCWAFLASAFKKGNIMDPFTR